MNAPNNQTNLEFSGEKLVQPVKFGQMNIFFLKTVSGFILVDTGMPNMGEKLDAAFAEYGVDPTSVHLIIATHGHLDHVGSIAYAQRVTGAKILCHQSLSLLLEKGESETAKPQNMLGRFLNLMTGLVGSKIESVKPDISIGDEFNLQEFGIGGKIIHTPGHSPGSLSIILDNGEALLGDMVREGKTGEIVIGMFYEDRGLVLESLEKVVSLNPKTIYFSHGTKTDLVSLKNFLNLNR